MYYPGSPGWIDKFFQLVDKEKISINLNDCNADIIDQGIETGLIFSCPQKTIFTSFQINEWTSESKIKALYFEFLLLIYLKANKNSLFNKVDFFKKINLFFFKSKKRDQSSIEIEEEIHQRICSNKKDLQNPIVFIDVLFFYSQENELNVVDEMLFYKSILFIIKLCIQADNQIDEKETYLFDTYKKYLEKKHSKSIDDQQTNKVDISTLPQSFNQKKYLTEYLLCTAIYSISLQLKIRKIDRELILKIGKHFSLPKKRIELLYAKTNVFIVKNKKEVPFLLHSRKQIILKKYNSYFLSLLKRNRRKITSEVKESKELFRLLIKSKNEKLSKKEKEVVKEQLFDILKTIPSIAIFLVPGGSFLLPIILKFIPSLLPSSFVDNKTDN